MPVESRTSGSPQSHAARTAVPARSRRHRVLIAGGGVGGLEAMLALRDLAGDRVDITVLTRDEQFSLRAQSVHDAFGGPASRSYPLSELCIDHEAVYVHDVLAHVDQEGQRVTTRSGRQTSYDSLVVAVGARQRSAFSSTATLRGPQDTEVIHGLIQDVEGGYIQSVAFVVPPGVTWPLPLYELALMTAERAYSQCLHVALTLITPEHEPLGTFGAGASELVSRLLTESGITVHAATGVADVRNGDVLMPNGDAIAHAQRAIALPILEAPVIPGIPTDATGFVPVDEHGRVRNGQNIWAVGDVTSYPLKQAGIAAQQADAAARSIAARIGAPVVAEPFRPILRAGLGTGRGLIYLREIVTGEPGGSPSAVSSRAPWSPPGKVAAAYLSSYLDGLDRRRTG
jgi:sulfide:quinone oxidoreductase